MRSVILIGSLGSLEDGRNIYIWIFALGILFGIPDQAFKLMALLGSCHDGGSSATRSCGGAGSSKVTGALETSAEV